MKKYLHVKNGRVAAISLEGESIQLYGAIVEVPYEEAYGVGDVYPRGSEAPTAPVRDVNATKPTGDVPTAIGSNAPKRKSKAE